MKLQSLPFVCFLLLILLLMTGNCEPPNGNPDRDNDSSPTPIMGPIPVQPFCPPITTITPCATISKEPNTYWVIWVDRSSSYQEWTIASLELLLKVLPQVVQPGDQVMIGWIGSKSEDPRQVLFQVNLAPVATPSQDPPPLFPRPLPSPTPIPTPTRLPGGHTTMQEIEYQHNCATIEAYNQAQATQTARNYQDALNEYYCQLQEWLTNCQQALAEYETNKQSIQRIFQEELNTHLNQAIQHFTPEPQETHIQEALYISSQIFQKARLDGMYSRYRLLILSDMMEYNTGGIPPLPINLTEVDVTVAMMYCARASLCEESVRNWTRQLENFNARSVKFLLVVESTPENLCRVLRR